MAAETTVIEEAISAIRKNQHEIYVISFDEMDSIVRSNANASSPTVKRGWADLKIIPEKGAGYYTTAKDIHTLSRLIVDLGGVATKATIKSYKGKFYIILKGRPGLRKILTGTRYGLRNPTVVAMGLGTANVARGCKSGGLITIILLTTYRVIDYVMSDKQTLTHLVGHIATDIVKVGITVGAALATLAIVGGTTIAIGPLAVAIVVGAIVSLTLDQIDAKFGLTAKVVAGLQALNDSAQSKAKEAEAALVEKAADAVSSIFEYILLEARDSAVDLIGSYTRRFLNPGSIR